METEKLVVALKKKFDCNTDKELAKILGISSVTMSKWKNGNSSITPTQIANIIFSATRVAKEDARLFSIKPIVEYYPIEASESPKGAKWELFDCNSVETTRFRELRKYLESSSGVYIFYDSQCRALYVGKAKEQDLWSEMVNAFNRDRDTQKIYVVEHPTIGQNFKPAFIHPRQPRKVHFKLCDLASYFSAYEVHKDLIDNIEATLIRSFANTTLNAKMEKIKIKS